jgi:YegS/Rv2252/BmrU family lipid kinase
VEDRVDAVVVLGGDGTAMQVARGVVGHEVPVGIVPVGTGNLLAGNLGLPRKPEQAARVIVEGVVRRIDLGRVERENGTQFFAVACGAGLDAALMAGTTGASKRRWGMAAYVATLWGALPGLQAVPHRVTVDGTTLHTDAVSVLVANCGEIIPRVMRLKEGIAPDDGLLDVVILRAASALDGMAVLGRLLARRTQGSTRIRYARGRRITVEADEARPVELDGEVAGQTPFTAEVLEGAIRLFVPRRP